MRVGRDVIRGLRCTAIPRDTRGVEGHVQVFSLSSACRDISMNVIRMLALQRYSKDNKACLTITVEFSDMSIYTIILNLTLEECDG